MSAKIKNTIDMSSFAKTNLKDMFEMFMLFEGDEVILNGMDTSNVENMKYLFQFAKVNRIDLRNIDTSNVTSISEAFQDAEIGELLLPNSFTFVKNANFSYMFLKTKIPKLDLSGMDTSNVSNMSYLLYNSKVEEIILPKKFSFDSINDESGMYNLFYGILAKTIDLTSINVEDKMIGSAILCNTNFDTIYVKSEEDAEWFRKNGDYTENNFNYVVKK